MKRTTRLIAAMLCIMLAFGCLAPASAAAAKLLQTGGSFYLTASTATATIIEPVRVDYAHGQTVKEALQASGHTFSGIESGFITAIDGVRGNFVRFYDYDESTGECGYDLDAAASDITAIGFAENEVASKEMIALITLMGDFNYSANGVLNYPAAKTAYADALRGLRNANAEQAQLLFSALDSAMRDYAAYLEGDKYDVVFNVTQNGITIENPVITITDAYGNASIYNGTTAQAYAGVSTYSVSDGGHNRIEGRVTVSPDAESGEYSASAIDAALPYGEWFGDIIFHADSGALEKLYEREQDYGTHTATYKVEDTNHGNVYMYLTRGADLPSDSVKTYACYVDLNGRDNSDGSVPANNKGWESRYTVLTNLWEKNSMTERSFDIEARYYVGEQTQIQSFEINLERIPTLADLQVFGSGTRLPMEFAPLTGEYSLTTVAESVVISPFPVLPDYRILVNGNDTQREVVLKGIGESTAVDVTVEYTVNAEDNITRTFSYTLNITRLQATDVNVIIPAGTEAEIINAAGGVIQPLVCGEVVDGVYVNTYALTPGEEYDCIATKNRYFHTSASFTAAEGTDFTVSEPESTDKLTAVGAYTARNVGNANTRVYPLDRDFVSAEHEYMFTVSDANSSFFMKATCNDDAYEIHALYDKQTTIASTNGVPVDKLIDSTVESTAGAVACGQFVASNCGYANTMTLRLIKTVDSVEYYQEYTFVARRSLSLGTLSAKTQANGIVNDIVLRDENGSIVKYDRDRADYYATIALSIPEVIISASFKSTASETAPNKGGYYLLVNGERFDDPSNVSVSLDSALSSEDITVTICHEDDASVQSTYTLHLAKTAPTPVRFVTEPADAITFVISNSTSLSVPKNEDGTYSLIPGESYAYTVTKAGFAGVHESNYIPVQSDEVIEINAVLTAAEPNPNLDPNLDAQWPTFRANRFNNGVVDYPIPTIANDSVLYWATQFGSGYGSNACSCPIIVDDFLYVYAGTNIYKIDKTSGEALVTKSMAASSSFAINSPTYADGMIFVGLSNGRIQAFDAVTLDSLWLFTDSNGGQPNCPIVYHDGYIYTGFWKSETGDASFVCVSATDEDPDVGNETKYASWRYVSKGGFYWAGAYVCDEFVLIDTDDGESGYTDGHARIVSLNPTSGSVLGSITLPHPGDARSSVTFVPDEENGTNPSGTAYFTTKGGYFYAVHVEADGSFTEGSLSFVKLFNYADDPSNPAMSTCTPTIYNGRAYVGVSGTSQFGAYSGHNITVIDLESMSIAYTVRTKGYPQTSGVLTTAYAGDDDTVYVYFFDNFTPGMLRVIADRPGQTEPSAVVQEEYQGTTYDCAPVLFTPDGAQAQYAICSPIIDADGTIYFKNDSAYLMAVGSVVDRIEIAKLPDKTVYTIGETFDPTGMQVLAHYANGTVRDITAYAVYSTAPLTSDDNMFIISHPSLMYQNRDGVPGTEYHAPDGVINLVINAAQPTFTVTYTVNGEFYAEQTYAAGDAVNAPEYNPEEGFVFFGWDVPETMPAENITIDAALMLRGDANGSGSLDTADSLLMLRIALGIIPANETERIICDMDGDGAITSIDALLVFRKAMGIE